MRKTALRTLASLAVLAVLSVPHATTPQACANPAARTLLAGALADSVLNLANQEDNQFFTSQAGFPNIFFVVDTSTSMARLPPNGPTFLAGGSDPAFLPTTQVGCGADPELGSLAANPMLDVVASRIYHSPCGSTPYDNSPYAGHIPMTIGATAFGVVGGIDYAVAPSVQAAGGCSYYTPSGMAFGLGYDPDFYEQTVASTNLSSGGGKPNLFPRDRVFHDSVGDGPTYSPTTAPFGNGWNFTDVFPYRRGGSVADIEQFCTDQGATLQNGLTRAQICMTCMAKKGWYYDGTIQTQTQDGITNAPYPSIWYTGNYLTFYPPKFVVARKVVKDVIAAQDRIRMALAQFGPSGYTFVRDFNPSCSSVFSGGQWQNNRSTYVNDVNALDWGGGTPLSLALFDVGRYYHTPTLPWFGGTWESSATGAESATSANQLAVCWSCQSSSVIVLTDGVPSVDDGNTLPPGPSSIADSDTGKYAGDTTSGILGASTADCPRCADFTGADSYKNNLTKVAFYMHNYDLRGEAAGACGGNGGTLDGKGMPGKQVLDLYTVGFGVRNIPDASRILINAASVGGGTFVPADSADQLRQGIFNVFSEINDRATSFSVATVSTLQTTTGHSVIVPRFDPSREASWAGHLYRYELYSEFVNACTPNGVGDLDCDGLCASVFLQDRDGRFIAEDGNGHFVRTDNNLPSCSETPRCVALGKPCGTLTNVPASPWWDAYEALKAQTWRSRYVWTVTDNTGDGKFTAADALLRLEPTDIPAGKLVPYLGLGTTGGVCEGIARKISTANDDVTASVVRSSKLECAKTIIRFILGADVFNEMGRNASQGWPPPRPDLTRPATIGDAVNPPNLPDQDQLLDRKFKLGDIYHSSPVVVDAPLPADGILCPNGLHNQCTESLWRTPVKHVNDVNQYDLYAKSAALKTRRKVILVGSNDGLLHAFNGGGWHANADDPVTAGIDESKAPFEGYYDRGEQNGGPVELWAFLPPDLLGKVPNMLLSEHQLLVDGTAMVRDVWVDGADNNVVAPPAARDDKKAASEFHTVAVVGERRGGNHYFALDVTSATGALASGETGVRFPKFLWIYPQPTDPESLTFGETYTEFLPVPPPIGPVRIKADDNAFTYGLADGTNAPSMYVPETPLVPVKYHELWVTMLPGGLDPQFLRGRGVHMVDVWTGKEVLDFSYPTDLATVSWMDTRIGLTYPVAATPAMVMWGKQARRPSLGFENEGYFDTSTFGDLGGQLWAVRFNRPGVMDTRGKVQNWFGGRIFTHGYSWVQSLCTEYFGHPFYYITANTALPGSHVFRVYAGTGDRFNLLDTNGGICGPDNIRACAQSGCTVSVPLANNAITATGVGYNGQGLEQPVCWNSLTRSQDLATAPPVCGATALSRIEVSACPDATGATGFSKDVGFRCTMDADGDYGCKKTMATTSAGAPAYGSPLTLANNLWSHPKSRNWYFSLKVFDDTGPHTMFDDAYNAYLYDAYRMTLYDEVWSLSPVSSWSYSWNWMGQSLVHIDGSNDNPTTLADATSAGWAIFYNHGPTITTDDHTYNINLLDERTSSVSGLYGKVLWNSMQPALGEATSASGTCKQSKCQGAFRRLSYHYGADAVTGGPVFRDASGNPLRSIAQNTLVPAQGDQPTVFVNQKGQIAVGLTAVNPEKGASNLGMGAAMDPVMGLGVVEVSRDLHECRHFKAAAADGTLTALERTALETKCKVAP